MNSEAGNDGIEPAESGKWVIKVVADNGEQGVVGKTFPSGFEHSGRKIDGDRLGAWILCSQQREQAAIACAQVEHPVGGVNASRAASASPRCEIESACPRYCRIGSGEVHRFTGRSVGICEKY